jgi:hypothetical protein
MDVLAGELYGIIMGTCMALVGVPITSTKTLFMD